MLRKTSTQIFKRIDFRYNLRNVEDSTRAVFAIRGSEAKDFMYSHSS